MFTSLLYHSDLILTWDSHQQALVQLLAEHSSLFGLNVKVFNRDTEMFPGGFQFHQRHDFMRKMLRDKTDTYIFHMSWTGKCTISLCKQWFTFHNHNCCLLLLLCAASKKEKLLFLRQVRSNCQLLLMMNAPLSHE